MRPPVLCFVLGKDGGLIETSFGGAHLYEEFARAGKDMPPEFSTVARDPGGVLLALASVDDRSHPREIRRLWFRPLAAGKESAGRGVTPVGKGQRQMLEMALLAAFREAPEERLRMLFEQLPGLIDDALEAMPRTYLVPAEGGRPLGLAEDELDRGR